jgi:hypothetical protein
MLDADASLNIVLSLAALGSCIADCELLSIRSHLKADGMLSPLSRWSRAAARFSLFKKRLNFLGDYPYVIAIIAVRLCAAAFCLTAFRFQHGLVFALAIYVVASALLQLRGGLGNNGSDEMLLLLMVSLFVAKLSGSILIGKIALFFIAAQLTLAYLTAGLVKVVAPLWRNGQAFIGLMSTETFGNNWLYTFLARNPRIALVTSVSVFGGEIVMAFAPWMPFPYAATFLGLGLVFHILIAVTMGLNTFFFAFAAAYPAALYTASTLYPH